MIKKTAFNKGIAAATIIIAVIIVIAVVLGAYVILRPRITPKPKFKIAIVTDTGGRGDLAFNDMAFKGGEEAAKDFNLELVELISKTESDYFPNLRTAAQDPDVQLIVANGFLMTDALFEIAQEFPDKNFVSVECWTQDKAQSELGRILPNVIDFKFVQADRAALAGALATFLAAYYNQPHIGGVLGIEIPPLWWLETGYKWGCNWAISWIENNKPEMKRGIYNTPPKERVLYTYTGSFSDITKGYEAAKPMYAKGAVAVYNMGGAMGLGINQAVAEIASAKGLEMGPPFWIGVDSVQDWINPGFVIASTTARNDRMVYYSAKLVLENRFRETVQTYNGVIWFGLASEILGTPVKGEELSTLADVDEFIEMGIKAEKLTGRKVLPMSPDKIRAKVKAMREAQPQWIWEAVSELEEQIRTRKVEVPMPKTSEEIQYWRSIFG
jgi:basic membrane protein A